MRNSRWVMQTAAYKETMLCCFLLVMCLYSGVFRSLDQKTRAGRVSVGHFPSLFEKSGLGALRCLCKRQFMILQ